MLVLGGVVGLVAALFLSAVYPVAAQESTSTAMSGMAGMSGASMAGSSGQTAATATCTRGNNGAVRAGLDVNNTPNMIMAGPGTGMNMNGADASAAAGLNTTKANWHYTGPALPTVGGTGALGPGRERADRHPHAHQWVRVGTHLLRRDQCGPVRPEHESGGGPLLVPRCR